MTKNKNLKTKEIPFGRGGCILLSLINGIADELYGWILWLIEIGTQFYTDKLSIEQQLRIVREDRSQIDMHVRDKNIPSIFTRQTNVRPI